MNLFRRVAGDQDQRSERIFSSPGNPHVATINRKKPKTSSPEISRAQLRVRFPHFSAGRAKCEEWHHAEAAEERSENFGLRIADWRLGLIDTFRVYPGFAVLLLTLTTHTDQCSPETPNPETSNSEPGTGHLHSCPGRSILLSFKYFWGRTGFDLRFEIQAACRG
jgi:hypothetical protein